MRLAIPSPVMAQAPKHALCSMSLPGPKPGWLPVSVNARFCHSHHLPA